MTRAGRTNSQPLWAAVWTDVSGLILDIDPALAARLNTSAHAVQGRSFLSFIVERRPEFLRELQALRAHCVLHSTATLMPRDGRRFRAEIQMTRGEQPTLESEIQCEWRVRIE